jgi:hypothetical protein
VRKLFIGFEYQEPSKALFSKVVPEAIKESGWQAVMPLAARPGGLMLDRILGMIRYSERNLYEVSQPNGNVWFELGMSTALRIPTALTTRLSPEHVHDLLRGAFLHVHKDDPECIVRVNEFLVDLEPPEIVPRSEPQTPDPVRVMVIGEGDRAATIAERLQTAGYGVDRVTLAAFGSLADAVRLAEAAGAVVAVRPGSDGSWPNDAIGQLVMLGAAFALGRKAVLAASGKERIPSDCVQLSVRGADDVQIAAAIVERLQAPAPAPPPSGILRPRIVGAQPRPLATVAATLLEAQPTAFLDAEPGYGKTTIASQTADRLGWPVAWLTVAGDWSLGNLVERIVAAVEPHAPGFGWSALGAVFEVEAPTAGSAEGPVQTSRDTLTPESVAALLLADADRGLAPDRVLLVVDDVHLASRAAGRLLATLAAAPPQWLRTLFVGRGGPDALAQLEAQGKLPTWHSGELKFTIGETTRFLREAIPSLPDTHVALLHRRTEGWPAALAVIRLWLLANSHATLADLQARTRGDRHQIYAIFTAGYFETLSGDVRKNLLNISLPPIISSLEAEYLLGEGGGERLRELVGGPYFLVEEATDSFRYHSLFREFLAQRWREERGPNSLRETRSEMAKWYLGRSNPAASYQLACDAEDWDTAEEAIEPVVRVLGNAGDAGLLRSLLERLPIERIRRSRLLLEGWVRALSYTGDRSAIDEGRRLVAMPDGTPVEHGLARLLLAQLRVDFRELDEAGYAAEADAVAGQLLEHEPKLALQARHQSFQARSMHSADPAVWPSLTDEAMALAKDAHDVGAQAVEAIAKAEAADLLMRISQHRLQRQATALGIRRAAGSEMPEPIRVAMARQLVALQDESLRLIREATSIADALEDSMLQATVQLVWARMVTLSASTSVFQHRALTDDARKFGELAIGLALGAAREYADRGMVRNVAIAYNSAAQAAAVIGDISNRDAFAGHAERLAAEAGYQDLVESARNIRSGPTPSESIEESRKLAQTEPDLPALVDAMLNAAFVAVPVQQRVRPVLLRTLEDQLRTERANMEVCQHLCLVYQDTAPTIDGFASTHPRRRAVCRLRGIMTRSSTTRGAPLLRLFADSFCSNCHLRAPGKPATPAEGGDEAIYQPLIRRIRDGQPAF